VTVDPAFEPLTGAVRDRQAVSFDYRTPDDDAAATRRLQPWGVVCWRGRWYVVGHDLDRGATRCFRLSRVVTSVRRIGRRDAYTPPQVDLIDYVARWSGPIERTGRVTVLVRPGKAAGVRRWAEESVPGPDGDRLVLRYADVEFIANWLVGYGADVRVLDPPEVRDEVIARLRSIATAYETPASLVEVPA
jgi:proteasome accessory factor B